MDLKTSRSPVRRPGTGLGLALLLFLAVIAFLFRGNFLPGHTLFSNDGPLGTLMSRSHHLPEGFSGGWQDLNTIGFREGGAWPSVTYALLWLLGPVGYSKLYAPVALVILGLGAWCFFRQLGFAPLACILGGLAASLNSGFFSAGCWGVAAHPITIGMSFFALAALVDTSSRHRWLRVALAGLAVGMGVAEGADIGAIFSLYVAAFVMYQAWLMTGQRSGNLAVGVGRVAVVALFAAFLAAQSMFVLIATQIQGVAGTQQDTRTKEERWDYATQWSLPKREALGLVIPGLFGYRMDTTEGGNYWGAAGRDPSWYRFFESNKQGPAPVGPLRFTGGGNYAGVLVVLVAFWAALQSFRKKDSVFSEEQRRWIWFWAGVLVVSLLLAFGRFAPFYRLLYALPYFSTIRNPAKFVHVVNWALVVLFGYGVHGLWRTYMEGALASTETLRDWWERVRGFDRHWTIGTLAALAICVLGWFGYGSNRNALEAYLQQVGFDAEMARSISGFSIGQVAWFVFFFGVAVALVMLVLSGVFKGPRAKWGAVLLGLFLVVDLGRANQPWIVTWDYEQKYATNPVIDTLRNKPYEHRVAILPRMVFSNPQLMKALNVPPELVEQEDYIGQFYGIEWAQHHFLYYDIQSLDIVQMPRMPEDLLAFESALQPRTVADFQKMFARKWQLTNTRYLLGATGLLGFLNQVFDPAQQRFRIAERFQIEPKSGVVRPTKYEDLTAVPVTNGNFALFEFTGALPRAKLYSGWQVATNDQATLQQLADPSFDPEKSVLVAGAVAASGTNQAAGKVEFTSYAPKDIVLKSESPVPSVLLLNDRYDPNWQVLVDRKPETLLRCNYLMRGVYLPAGTHQVEFVFRPPMNTFWVSLAAVCLGIVIGAVLLVVKVPTETPSPGAGDKKGNVQPAAKAKG